MVSNEFKGPKKSKNEFDWDDEDYYDDEVDYDEDDDWDDDEDNDGEFYEI